MSKHAPGPWRVLNARKEDWLGRHLDYWTVTADDGNKLLCASPKLDQEHDEESTANARLIAAAPELLESLEYAIKQVPELATVPGIAAAIAKATGGYNE